MLTILSVHFNIFTHIKSSICFICCYFHRSVSQMSKDIETIDNNNNDNNDNDNNHEAKRLAAKTHDGLKSLLPPIFILCNRCLWAATYFDKNRLPDENICLLCGTNNNELSSLPIMPNESFTFSYDAKRGLEIEFKPRPKYNSG